ncbi:hypothetical protein CSE_03590 [Caldisericum exile AZM16c01]|uniref:Polymer-forming cytoskeletal protein n=1 Tax=Caldisericum exile (strain DSM 21853 / NBRC 104410 / AZM16c01) TaxID=511051 RepID=A0A7U6GDS3_CALEA|nr:hypothetical protein CSE_03590 [Caldisericum exile AZM16c01]
MLYEFRTGDNFETENIIYTLKDLYIGKNCRLKEVYSKGTLYVDENSEVRAIASDSDMFLGKNVFIKRWIDSMKSIFVSAKCNLGVVASAGENIVLSQGVKFERLFAKRIMTYNIAKEKEKDSYIIGTIKSDEDIEIKGNIEIVGNLISEGKIKLHDNVAVKGNVFSQVDIELNNGIRIGIENKIKSVVANGKVILGEDVIVYGFISSKEGETK